MDIFSRVRGGVTWSSAKTVAEKSGRRSAAASDKAGKGWHTPTVTAAPARRTFTVRAGAHTPA
jgi:hypothetical protein